MQNNNNQNFNQQIPNATSKAMNPMSVEFANEIDVNQIKQKIQQAEANKNQASGRFATPNAMSEEFGTETDVNQVRQQIQQAEANKYKASGSNANNGNENNTN